MKRISLLWPLALLSVLVVALPGAAEARRDRHPGARLERHIDELGLDPATSDKVHAILDAAKNENGEVRDELRGAFEHMRELLEQDSPNEEAVMQQADKIGALKTQVHKAMLHTLLQVRALLTPEQRQKLMEMKHHRRPPWHRRRNKNVED